MESFAKIEFSNGEANKVVEKIKEQFFLDVRKKVKVVKFLIGIKDENYQVASNLLRKTWSIDCLNKKVPFFISKTKAMQKNNSSFQSALATLEEVEIDGFVCLIANIPISRKARLRLLKFHRPHYSIDYQSIAILSMDKATADEDKEGSGTLRTTREFLGISYITISLLHPWTK